VPARGRTGRGLTLIEVVLSVALIILLTGTLFAFYESSLKMRDSGTRRLRYGALAQSIAYRIAEEIRSANGFIPGLGPGISGYRHEITLQTVTLTGPEQFLPRSIKDRPLPAESDVREVRYYLAVDPETSETYLRPDGSEEVGPATLGIVRREVKTLRQSSPLGRQYLDVDLDLITSELRYLRFRYFDGVEWVDEWQLAGSAFGNSLPQAVEVTVGYRPDVPKERTQMILDESTVEPSEPETFDPDRYTLVVRLHQADTFMGSRLMRASTKAFGSGGGLGGGGFGGN
jgi:hypothetical protein